MGISRLKAKGSRTMEEEERLQQMTEAFDYMGNATCAADGMCQEKCPVKINTGELIKTLRQDKLEGSGSDGATPSPMGARVAKWMAQGHVFGPVMRMVPPLLDAVSLAHAALGTRPVQAVANLAWGVGNNMLPLWNPYMPR